MRLSNMPILNEPIGDYDIKADARAFDFVERMQRQRQDARAAPLIKAISRDTALVLTGPASNPAVSGFTITLDAARRGLQECGKGSEFYGRAVELYSRVVKAIESFSPPPKVGAKDLQPFRPDRLTRQAARAWRAADRR